MFVWLTHLRCLKELSNSANHGTLFGRLELGKDWQRQGFFSGAFGLW